MNFRRIIIAVSTAIILLAAPACKKNRLVKNETGQVSEDNSNIQSSIDAAVNDANNAVSSNSSVSGKLPPGVTALSVCGATVDTSQRTQGILTLNFDGTTDCNGRTRSGKIKLTLKDFASGKRWKDVGAVLDMEYTNFKVVRTSDNKYLTFNGTTSLTNVSGGNVILMVLGFQPNVVHKNTGNNLQVLFDDGKTATFNLSRQFTHTYSNNVYQVKGEGVGTYNGLSNIENWGTTRDGDNFTSQVLEPVIWNSTCGAAKPTKGKLDIVVDSKEFSLTTTLGVDASGNVVSSGCPWGLKVEWKYKNKTGSKLYQYH